MPTKLLAMLTVSALLSLPLLASADQFTTVQTDKSTLNFGYKQMGVSMAGSFKKFSAQMSFDPTNLASSKAQLEIDLASIDVGSDEGNDEVVDKQWFNVKAFPKATFVTTAIKSTGPNHYDVTGNLTIKGKTKVITAPSTVTIAGKLATFDGTLGILRSDYSIGEGEWAKFDTVANEIQIKFHILANAAK